MKHSLLTLSLVTLLFVGCVADQDVNLNEDGYTKFSVSVKESVRTEFGTPNGDSYPVYWSEGDCICVNGIESTPVVIDSENRSRAEFSLKGLLNPPYNVTYPYCSTTTADSPKVQFLSEQNYVEGSFDRGSVPMCGYAESGNNISLKYLAGILRVAIRSKSGAATVLSHVTVTSETPMSGEFEVNCQNATISATENCTNEITYLLPENFTLSSDSDRVMYIAIPCGKTGKCTFTFTSTNGGKYIAKWNGGETSAGSVRKFSSLIYDPKLPATMLESMVEVDIDEWDDEQGVTVKGYVYCDGQPISDVVVSDGLLCTKSNKNGYFALKTDLSTAKFIMASIPSGYSVPTDANGLPIFYHRISDKEREAQLCSVEFEFNKLANTPDRFTLLVAADPQPRASTAGYDNNAYHSLDCCNDLYRDMREKAATITDRNVYGLMLGDVVHEDLTLYDNYIAGLKMLGFPMFNVLGNHDNDKTAKTDVEGRRVFEEKLGPTYYSFNIGKLHFVVLDNLIMTLDSSDELTGTEQGLTDEIMEWLRNDLSYVTRSAVLMVAAHSPMTKLRTGGSRTTAAKHFADYTALFAEFAQAHIWSGHTHKTFNYNYPKSSELYPIEEHTVARSTGELWTNEYEVGGTPRGYTVVEVDGDNVSWYFKPTIYQTGSFVKTSMYTSKEPSYTYRDWNYSSGVAKMKSDNSTLSESYQMKVYAPGTYHDTFDDKLAGAAANDYIYVNVFMWDDKWQTPTFNGQKMEHIKYYTAYSLAEYDIINHYYTYGYTLAGKASYEYVYGKDMYVHTLFRIKAPSATGSGAVAVTDRFGNEYSQKVSW